MNEQICECGHPESEHLNNATGCWHNEDGEWINRWLEGLKYKMQAAVNRDEDNFHVAAMVSYARANGVSGMALNYVAACTKLTLQHAREKEKKGRP